MADSGWPESTAVWEQLSGVYSRVGDSFLVFTVLWGTAVRAYTVVWAEFLAEYSRVGDSCPGVDSLGGKSSLVVTVWWSLYVPEKAGEDWLVSLDSAEKSVGGGSRFRGGIVDH